MPSPKPDFALLSARYASLPDAKRAAFRAELAARGISSAQLPIVPLQSRGALLPLSHGQEQLYMSWKLAPGSSAYNVVGAVRLTGALDPLALERAARDVVRRHEVLRTTFVEVDGVPRQHIAAAPSFEWRMTETTVADREHRSFLRAPFDLATGPLLRMQLVLPRRVDASIAARTVRKNERAAGRDASGTASAPSAEQESTLLLAAHHIVCDEWSLGILLRQLVAAYAGKALEPAAGVGFGDVSLWQREWIDEAAIDAQLAYWRDRLGDERPRLRLPPDRELGEGPSPIGKLRRSLSSASAGALRELAKQERATPFMLLFACWATVLSRFCAERDVRVLVPVAGRSRRETHDVVGFFVNTIVLRVQLERTTTFAALVDQVRQRLLEAQAHQDVPLSRVIEGGLEISFNLQVDDAQLFESLPGLKVTPLVLDAPDAKFELSLNVTESSDTFALSFDYAADRFDAESIAAIADDYELLLQWVLAQPSSAVLGAPGATTTTTTTTTTSTNATAASNLAADGSRQPSDRAFEIQGSNLVRDAELVVARVREHARVRPHEIAVVNRNTRLSWRALWDASGRLSAELRARGVGTEACVALCLPRSEALVIAILATWRASATFVPLDVAAPPERSAWQLSDCGARVVIADGDFPWLPSDIVRLSPTASSALPLETDVAVHSEQAAYVLYTSGTSARPKGVVVSHAALARYVAALLARLPDGITRAGYVSTPAADLGHTTLFGALFAGFELHLADEDTALDPDRFAAFMREHAIDLLKMVPTHLGALLEAANSADVLPRRCLVLGGEVSGLPLVRRITTLRPECRIFNHYGPTETTVGVLVHAHRADVAPALALENARPNLPLGLPLGAARVHIADVDGEACPRGAIGEIVIGGDTLARGYLERPGLTADRFVPDPTSTPGRRCYRSGDRGRQFTSGTFEFLGRTDDQVKIRGYRVEPSELTIRLRELPGVSDAAVSVTPDASGRSQLQAYAVGAGLDPEQLRRELERRLPTYLVPATLQLLDALPRTPNGKLDRAALLTTPAAPSGTRTLPRTAAERTLFEIWCGVLGRDDFGVSDDFFRLGGESILTLQVVARARQAGMYFTAKDLFAHPRIDRLAAVAREAASALVARPELRGELPKTPIQARFFEIYPSTPAHWNQALLLSVRGAGLDPPRLERAFDALVQRHDALRLRVIAGGALAVGDAAGGHFEHVDLRVEPRQRLEAACERAQESLDLATGQLLRAVYFELADDQSRVLIVVHHLAIDGVSWRIFLEELEALYAGETLPPVITPWSVWATELMAHAARAPMTEDLAHYRANLALVESNVRPLPRAQGIADRRRGAVRELDLAWDATATQQMLAAGSGGYGLQLDELLISALAYALAAVSGGKGALLELEGHGREDVIAGVDISRTLGWFTTRFPVYIAAPDSAGDALLQAKETLRSIPSKGLGWGLLAYGPRHAEVADLPRSEISFNYLGRLETGSHSRFALAPESSGTPIDPATDATHPLDVVASITEGALSISIRYLPSLIEPACVERLAREFEARVAVLLEHARASARTPTASDFPLARITQAELAALRIAPEDLEDVYPATAIQSGLIFHGLLATGSGVYVNQRCVTLNLGPQPEAACSALRAAWTAVVQRHTILRTHFEASARGQMLQVVHRSVELPYAEHSLRDGVDYDAHLSQWREQDLVAGFDLARAPLLRVNVFERPDGRHDLVWTNHHALLDGWSTARVLAEVAQHLALRAARIDRPRAHSSAPRPSSKSEEYSLDRAQAPQSRSPERSADPDASGPALASVVTQPSAAPVPFRTFVDWYLSQPSAEAFWRAELSFAETPARLLPALGPVFEGEPGVHRIEISSARGIDAVARNSGVTLGTFAQAAWALVLARYAARRYVVFGVTVAGRPAELPASHEMLGPFLNSLPLVVDVDPRATPGTWLQDLQRHSVEIRQYEHTPLHDIQRWAGTSGDALFDSLVVFENYPVDESLRSGVFAAISFEATDRTHYPLVLTVSPEEDRLAIELAWDGEKLGRACVEQLARHYLEALRELASDRPVGSLALSAPPPMAASALAVTPESVLERVRAHAEQQPDADAVIAGSCRLSYAQLVWRADQLARRLVPVAAEEVIGLCVSRSEALAIGSLGIWAANAAYLPIDRESPPARVAAMLARAGVRRVVAERASYVEVADVDVVWLDDQVEPRAQPLLGERPGFRAGHVSRSPRAQQLAYVMFTSGSTGEPKGVAVSHAALAAHCDDCAAFLQLQPSDRVYQFSTASFDASVEQLFAPLAAGACVVIRGEEIPDGARFCAELAARDVTVVDLPTAYFQRALVDADRAADLAALPALRLVSVGGEALSPAALARFRHFAPVRPALVNTYGPTETTASATMHVTTHDDEARMSVGRALPSRSAYLLDDAGNSVPRFGSGELCIGGVTLARGYAGRPGETAVCFVPSPFEPGARIYRTGDLARRLPDDRLELIGRRDTQVKLRGFRVELGEIEQALHACPGVREAAVVFATQGETSFITAYVAGEVDEAVTLRELARSLPAFMLPSALVVLPSLPLRANGKVDRAALPAAPQYSPERVAPRHALERTLLEIWSEVLGRPELGVTDNFFTAGGDSILSLQIVARARAQRLQVTLKQIFEYATVAELARVARPLGAAPEAFDDGTRDVPLTPIQRQFFALFPGLESHYNQAILVRTRALDLVALERALNALVARHESLRLRFDRSDSGEVRAHVSPHPETLQVETHALTTRLSSTEGASARVPVLMGTDASSASMPPSASAAARATDTMRAADSAHEESNSRHALLPRPAGDVRAIGLSRGRTRGEAPALQSADWQAQLSSHAERIQRSLDIASGPLLRAAYFSLGEAGEGRLLLVAHHLAVDAVSWRIFLDELEHLYTGERDLPPATGFGRWARAVARYAQSDAVGADRAFWDTQLSAARNAEAVRRELDTEPDLVERSSSFDPAWTARLVAAAPRAYRLRVEEMLLAAWVSAIDDPRGVLIDIEGHGRQELDTELDVSGTLGWFTTQYPLWIAPTDARDPRAVLLAVKATSRRVSAQRGFHYGLLQTESRALPRAAFAFNYLGQVAHDGAGVFSLADESIGNSAARGGRSHPLELGAMIRDAALSVWLRGPRSAVERQRERFDAALRRLIEHAESAGPTATPEDFPLAVLAQPELDALRLGDVEDVFAATPAQQGLLFHGLDERGLYVDQFCFTLRGELDVPALRAAWQAVLARHEALRSRFVLSSSGTMLQVIERSVELPLSIDTTARTLGAAGYASELARQRAADLEAGFALDRAPLLRLRLFERPDAQHDLLWTSHHALLDGWSTSILLGEVLQLYHAPQLELERPPPYRAYLRWLAARTSSEAWWRAVLAKHDDAPAQLMHCLPRPRQPVREHQKFRERLPASLDERLKLRAKGWQVTLSTLLQAAWAAVLAQSTNRTRVAFGITVSGRPPALAGVEQMLGLFINSLPVWSELRPSAHVVDYLRELQRHALELSEHEHTPLASLAKWAGLPADTLFDTLFVFENYPIHDGLREAGPSALELVELDKVDQTHYPLVLTLQPEPVLQLEWEWDAERISRATAEQLAAAYQKILVQLAAASSDTRFADLFESTLPAPQPLAAHDFRSLPGRLISSFSRFPDRTAVYCEGAATSYVELADESARIAVALRNAGVGAESRVGVSVSRSASLVSALAGVWRAGGAYVPLDPSYPAARLAEMLDGVEVVVCDAGAHALFEGRRVIRIDALPPEPVRAAFEEPHPDQLAYVIYTSGSTGRPKGVAVTHAALSAHVDDFLETYALTGDDRVLFSSTINFDVSLHELFPALVVGARVVMRGDDAWSLDLLTATLAEQQVTFARIATAYWQAWTRSLDHVSLPHLWQITVGGEGLAGDALARWCAGPLAHVPVDNLYGPTETTVAALRHRTTAADGGEAIVPIGVRFGSRTARVMSEAGQLAPAGGLGELCIGGPTVARGYLGMPGLTAERFVPDPERPGGRLYRSGDVCRERSDGVVEFLGRADAQVKLRGYRIELGEIESALRAAPGVTAAVAEIQGEGESRRLVGYVTGDTDLDLVSASLRARLPEYMVPSAFMQLPALPLMLNGKVDRRALPEPVLREREVVAPRSEIERLLWEIWCAVLKRDAISISDNFFELGGDSILSLQILARAREAGYRLTPKQLFEHPTIETCARVARPIAARTAHAERTEALPLTPIQARFFERYPGGLAHANQSVLLRSTQPLDEVVLARALALLVTRHDALRLRFRNGTQQVAAESAAPPLERIDLRATTDCAAALDREGDRLQRSLNLEHGPILRAAHFVLPGGEARLLVIVHHLAIDGVSWRILLEELELAYQGRPLPAIHTPWTVWANALGEYAASADLRAELQSWTQNLAAATALSLAGRARTLQLRSLALDVATTQTLLAEAPRAYRMRADEVLLTALARTLAAWSGQRGALIDLEGHGREDILEHVDPSRTVGWFTTRYPVWLALPRDANADCAALVKVKEQLRAVPHKGLHWGLMRYSADADLRARAAELPAPQVSFNYLGQFDQALAKAGPFSFAHESAGRELAPEAPPFYALNINALIESGALAISFQYSPELISDDRADALVESFGAQLRRLIEHCAQAPRGATASDFPLARLQQAQLERLDLPLADVQDIYPATPLQQGLLFHSLFEDAAGDGMYIYQLRLTLAGALAPSALRAAWQDVIARHDILRTQFASRHGDSALQVVRRSAQLPFVTKDWSRAPDYEARLAAFLERDLASGVPADVAPLMRVAVFARPDRKHDLVWTMHHALSDGWSSARLVDEVIEAYRARVQSSSVAEPRVEAYRDYVAWLAEQPTTEPIWRARLSQLREPARLLPASGRVRAPEPGTHHGYDTLSPEHSRELIARAQASHVTLSTLCQAAWGLALARFGHADQAVFGVTVSGRPAELPGSLEMIGLFINTLPVWVDVRPSERVGDWLRALQRQADELRHLEHTPLSDVQRWAGAAGDALFDTLVVFENFPVSDAARSAELGLRIERSERADRTHYPLTLTIAAQQQVELEWEWDGARVDRAVVESLRRAYVAALAQLAAADADGCVGELNTGERPEPQPLASHPYRAVVSRIGGGTGIALHCEGRESTYAELARWSNRIAYALRGAGVAAESRVGVCVSRSPGLVAALLGVWKAGGGYVPLDPTYPPARLVEMLDGVEVVLCDATTAHLPLDRPLVRIDQLEDGPELAHFADPRSEQLAYVIYTSGSSGRPKGVAITHGALSAHIDDFLQTYHLTDRDRVLFSSTINFDVSLHELFPALIAGGRVVMRGEQAWSLEALTATLREQRVTFSRIATAYWQAWTQRLRDETFPALRQVTVGGEGLAGDALVRWFAHPLASVPLDNLYGPTETTVAALRHRARAADGGEAIVPIGRPFPSRSARVIGLAGEIVDRGSIGELCIGGPTLARGYLGSPGLTAERFVPDPERAGARIYRSGDLCRERLDGSVEFLGRADAQVKLRGYRIELGEIESALRSFPGVAAAVAEIKGQGEMRRLVAYVIGAPDLDALKAAVASKLPAYMVPSAFVTLDALPILPNGKLNRRALPEPELAAREQVAPRTELERVLWNIWRAVLKRDEISVTDNFFELGGDSILSLQILARAREAGWKLTPKQVFDHPTIEASARVARPLGARTRLAEVHGELPLTPIQQRFFELQPAGPAHWNQSVLLACDRALDLTALERVASALVERHDALRQRFDRADRWRGRVVATASAEVMSFEVSGADALEREADRLQRSLDLQRGPLLRVAYFALPDGQARVLLIVHHLAVDGVSWRILLEELETAYAQAEAGEAIALPSISTPWSAWAASLARYAQRADAEERVAYWERALASANVASPDFGNGDRRVGASRALHWRLSREDTESLVQSAPRIYRSRVDEVLLTALAGALAAESGANGVLVDLEGHGREEIGDDDVDVSRTLGWFTTRFPVLLAPGSDPGRGLISVKEALRAVPNKGLDFGVLRYTASDVIRARVAALPRAWVSFNYLGSFDEALSKAGRFDFASEAAGDNMSADAELGYALELNGMITGGELSISFRYSPGVVAAATAEAWLNAFDARMRALLEHLRTATPIATASDFPLAKLTQDALDRLALPLAGSRAGVEDIYPATPLQQGLIFQSLLAPERGAYLNQLRLTLRGELDVAAMQNAWRSAIARHAILRTSFEWRHGGEALQIVRRHVELPWLTLDWSGDADYDARLGEFRAADLRRGFELNAAPLLRLTLIRRPDGAYDLLRTNHHALSDGWSAEQLFGEILETYAALRQAATPDLPAVATYRSYVAWLAARPSPRPYWERVLARFDDPATLRMALRVRTSSDERAEPFEEQLGGERSMRLRAIAQAQQVTLNTLMQAAWAVVLARLADRGEACFGATVSGRPPELPDVDRIVGPFINTLPVFVELPAERTIGDWLRDLQREASERRDFEYTPLHDLQQWARATGMTPRTLGGDALFDSLVVFENYPTDDELLSRDVGLTMEQSDLVDRTHYPLALTIVPEDASIKLEWEWDITRVSRTSVEHIAARYREVLAQLAEAPLDRPLARLGLAPSQPFAAPALGEFRSLADRVVEHASLEPAQVAVVCNGDRLTYGALDRLAGGLAAELVRRGVGREERIGVYLRRDVRLPAVLLGVLRAGAAFVPLDPSYPPARLRAMCERAAIRFIVASAPELAALGRTCIDVSALPDAYAPVRFTHPEQLAYLIFTSGSTGEPKGVGISQRALAAHLDDYQVAHGLGQRDVVYQFSTINFDVCVEQMFPALCAGARLVMRGPETPPLDAFQATLAVEHVTVVDLPTAYFQQWNHLLLTAARPALPALRLVTVGGEALPASAVAAWRQTLLREVRLDNCYGPTEATVTALCHETTGADATADSVPIGRPYPSRGAYVLDAGGEPAGAGALGELCLAGASLARGYEGRPGSTAERFVPDPFGPPGTRTYRTGDRVFCSEAGLVEFAGRRDQQVKVRGYRIELGDVEAALLRIAGVRAAAAAVRDDSRQLVACVVGDVSAASVGAELQTLLPAYLVPSIIEVVAALPVLPNGKVDRRALVSGLAVPRQRAAAAPRTPLEDQLCTIWSEVLGCTELGVNDDLAHAGADSLSALRVFAAAKRAGLDLALETIFGARSVSELASEVGRGASPDSQALNSVVALNQSAAPQTLFCVHPLYGTVGAYLPLAAALADVARVYGLRAPALTEPRFSIDSLEGLARDYVERIRRIQPEGPYLLLGWSFGGWVAAAMAHALEQCGEQVRILAVVDTSADVPRARATRDELERELIAEAQSADLDPEFLRGRVLDLLDRHEDVLAAHQIQPVRTPIHAFATTQAHPGASSWSRWSDAGAREVAIDTTHEAIVEHPTLIAALRRLLTDSST